jgi:predicted metalloprotease with PDZ domain
MLSRYLSLPVLILLLAASPILAAEMSSEEELPPEVKAAHEKLREALKEIRAYHGSELYEIDDEHLLAGDRFVWKGADFSRFIGDEVRIGVVIQNRPEGVYISAVTPGGPADEAGLRAGDVITHVDGKPLVSDDEDEATERLVAAIGALEEGDEVTLGYLRDDKAHQTKAVARKMEPGAFFYTAPNFLREDRLLRVPEHGLLPIGEWTTRFDWLSMELVSLNPELGSYFGTEKGVLVIRGPQDDKLDIRAGDVILAIDGREVRSPSHTLRILRSYDAGESLSIKLLRHKKQLTIETTIPEHTHHHIESLLHD